MKYQDLLDILKSDNNHRYEKDKVQYYLYKVNPPSFLIDLNTFCKDKKADAVLDDEEQYQLAKILAKDRTKLDTTLFHSRDEILNVLVGKEQEIDFLNRYNFLNILKLFEKQQLLSQEFYNTFLKNIESREQVQWSTMLGALKGLAKCDVFNQKTIEILYSHPQQLILENILSQINSCDDDMKIEQSDVDILHSFDDSKLKAVDHVLKMTELHKIGQPKTKDTDEEIIKVAAYTRRQLILTLIENLKNINDTCINTNFNDNFDLLHDEGWDMFSIEKMQWIFNKKLTYDRLRDILSVIDLIKILTPHYDEVSMDSLEVILQDIEYWAPFCYQSVDIVYAEEAKQVNTAYLIWQYCQQSIVAIKKNALSLSQNTALSKIDISSEKIDSQWQLNVPKLSLVLITPRCADIASILKKWQVADAPESSIELHRMLSAMIKNRDDSPSLVERYLMIWLIIGESLKTPHKLYDELTTLLIKSSSLKTLQNLYQAELLNYANFCYFIDGLSQKSNLADRRIPTINHYIHKANLRTLAKARALTQKNLNKLYLHPQRAAFELSLNLLNYFFDDQALPAILINTLYDLNEEAIQTLYRTLQTLDDSLDALASQLPEHSPIIPMIESYIKKKMTHFNLNSSLITFDYLREIIPLIYQFHQSMTEDALSQILSSDGSDIELTKLLPFLAPGSNTDVASIEKNKLLTQIFNDSFQAKITLSAESLSIIPTLSSEQLKILSDMVHRMKNRSQGTVISPFKRRDVGDFIDFLNSGNSPSEFGEYKQRLDCLMALAGDPVDEGFNQSIDRDPFYLLMHSKITVNDLQQEKVERLTQLYSLVKRFYNKKCGDYFLDVPIIFTQVLENSAIWYRVSDNIELLVDVIKKQGGFLEKHYFHLWTQLSEQASALIEGIENTRLRPLIFRVVDWGGKVDKFVIAHLDESDTFLESKLLSHTEQSALQYMGASDIQMDMMLTQLYQHPARAYISHTLSFLWQPILNRYHQTDKSALEWSIDHHLDALQLLLKSDDTLDLAIQNVLSTWNKDGMRLNNTKLEALFSLNKTQLEKLCTKIRPLERRLTLSKQGKMNNSSVNTIDEENKLSSSIENLTLGFTHSSSTTNILSNDDLSEEHKDQSAMSG